VTRCLLFKQLLEILQVARVDVRYRPVSEIAVAPIDQVIALPLNHCLRCAILGRCWPNKQINKMFAPLWIQSQTEGQAIETLIRRGIADRVNECSMSFVSLVTVTSISFLAFAQFILFLLTDPSRQTFLELGAGAGQSRHNRPGRNFHDLTYLLVREIFLVSQRQHLTEFRGQFIHCFSN